MFFTKPPKTFTEKLTSFNNFLFSLVSLFPLSLFFSSLMPNTPLQISIAGIDTGGLAGMNLVLIFENTINVVLLGFVSLFLYLTLQYLIF